MATGLRVIRGPDWKLEDDDGGQGHVGTVVNDDIDGTVEVRWDGGQVTSCRAAKDTGYDLRVLDNATVGVRHIHIVCDECGESGIYGLRWKCSKCYDYDLCSKCYYSDGHDCSHQFNRIEMPMSTPELQERRNKSLKMRVLGIFPDAVVVRGTDWEWDDQDGGKGCTGQVIEVSTPASHSARSTVSVKWENGNKNVYRRGYKGKMDLQYTEEASGLECYPQHLPVLDVSHYKKDMTNGSNLSENIKEGDSVAITLNAEQLREVQRGRSGWSFGMVECISKVGKVLGIAPNGDVKVNFGPKKYRIAPVALKKVASISVGNRVRIIDDEEKLKTLQRQRVGYVDTLRGCLGKVGEVVKVDEDGDIVVKFRNARWIFSPACCVPAPDADIDDVSLGTDDKSLMSSLGGGDLGADALLRLLAGHALDTNQMAGQALFFKAMSDGDENTALDMFLKNPQLASKPVQGMTALHLAANRGLLRLSKALVEAGIDLNDTDRDGDTPVQSALAGGQTEVAQYLIHKGCDVCKKNNNGQTASHKAVLMGSIPILRALQAAGADFNAQDDCGDTPLHDAIFKGHTSAAELILSWPGLDLHLTNKKGHPPLHFACMKDEPQIVEYIIRRDKTLVNKRKNDGFTPLHVCACNDHDKIADTLLREGGADVNIVDNEQRSPLHITANEAAFDCMKVLVQAGANVNARDKGGNTPLHRTLSALAMGEDNQVTQLLMLLGQRSKVSEETRTQMALFLLQHGADPEAKNGSGLAALDACPDKFSHVKAALKEYIAKGHTRASQGISSSMGAMSLSACDDGMNACRRCWMRKGDILFVPCGHRLFCKQCSSGLSMCPECKKPIKGKFDKDGKSVKQCIVM